MIFLTEADMTLITPRLSWKIAFRQLKFLQKGGSTYTRCRLVVGTIRYVFVFRLYDPAYPSKRSQAGTDLLEKTIICIRLSVG